MTCAVCGASLVGVFAFLAFEGKPEWYYRCPRCASLSLQPFPAGKRFNAHFQDAEAVRSLIASGLKREAYFSDRLNLIDLWRLGAPPGRLFEIGCGCGTLLKIAVERGWTVEACELSPVLAEHTRRTVPKATVHEMDVLECGFLEPGRFDAIIALDVLEHVTSPRRMLDIAHALLAPAGLLLLQTPNARSLRSRIEGHRWNMLIPDYHFHLFSARGLCGLIEVTGFTTRLLRTVSGTGEEQGLARRINGAKERCLSFFRLGNALLLLAGARHG